MSTRSLTDRTITGLAWAFSGAATQSLLTLIILATLARLLRPADFGVIGAGLVVIAFSQVIGQLGVGAAIVQRHTVEDSHVAVGFTLSTGLGFAIGIGVFALAPAFAVFFGMPALEPAIRGLAIIFPVTGLAVVGHALLQREMGFRKIAAIDFLSYALGYGALGVGLAFSGWGLWALVWAHVGQATLNALLVLLVKPCSVRFALNAKTAGALLYFGSGFSLARVGNYVANQGDSLVIGKCLGAESLGIYGRAYQFLMMPANFIGNIFDKVLFPAMVSVQGDRDRLTRAFARATGAAAMLTLPLTGLLLVLAPEIVWLLLGPDWVQVVTPFRILCLVLVFRTGYKVGHSLARAVGAVYETAWRQWVYAAAVVAGAWFGTSNGLGGVAVGVATAIALNFVLTLQLSLRLVNASWTELVRAHARYIALACATSLLAYLLKLLLETQGVRPMWVFTTVCGGTAIGAIFIWLCFRRFFGEEGTWLESIAKDRLRAAASRLGIA
jgi:O-antigen/teichoic acid export membrane protein